MRIPNEAHTTRPWRIHELVPDFRLEDVWELPGRGGAGDFPLLIQMFASTDPAQSSSWPVRTLFRVRWRLGRLLGWDDPETGIGDRVPTLLGRLPEDLRAAPRGPAFTGTPFTSLYQLEDEWAAEVANRTVHGVLHLSRIPDGDDQFRAHMAVYVKPNGLLGAAYMAAIKPFRYLIVYPRLLREGGRAWDALRAAAATGRE